MLVILLFFILEFLSGVKYLIILKYYFDVFVLYSSAIQNECLNSFTQISKGEIHAFANAFRLPKLTSYKKIQLNYNFNSKHFCVKSNWAQLWPFVLVRRPFFSLHNTEVHLKQML